MHSEHHPQSHRIHIQACWACRQECQDMLFNHCLEIGGKHLDPDHVRIMMDCIEMCQTAADAMVRRSPVHAVICTACAEVCDACADSCQKVGGVGMELCADACRECAALCRQMANGPHMAGRWVDERSGIMA
jgi:hypothetical protein